MDAVNETKKKRKIKPWNELTITDDFMFCKVMQNEKISTESRPVRQTHSRC